MSSPTKLQNLRQFLADNNIGYMQLARSIERSRSAITNLLERGNPTVDIRNDIDDVLRGSGYEIPEDLWIDTDGINHAVRTRTLRHLHSGEVVTCLNGKSALSRERRLNRYFSPHQLDPRKEGIKLQPLTLNARKRFGLKADPFRAELRAVDDVLLTREHNNAVEEMIRAATWQDFIAIIGEVGCGKTTCLELFQQRLPRNIRIIKAHTLDKSELNGNNLYDAIILDIAGTLDKKTTIPARRELKARRVINLLETLAKQDYSAVLVLDEGHGLSRDCLRALKRLHELDRGFMRLLGIIIIGQRELIPKLEDPTLREVGQRCARFEFRGLGSKTTDYLRHKITRAGGSLEKIFDPAAIRELEQVLTFKEGRKKYGPFPLQVNTYCTLALNLADELNEDRVTTDILDEIKPYSIA